MEIEAPVGLPRVLNRTDSQQMSQDLRNLSYSVEDGDRSMPPAPALFNMPPELRIMEHYDTEMFEVARRTLWPVGPGHKWHGRLPKTLTQMAQSEVVYTCDQVIEYEQPDEEKKKKKRKGAPDEEEPLQIKAIHPAQLRYRAKTESIQGLSRTLQRLLCFRVSHRIVLRNSAALFALHFAKTALGVRTPVLKGYLEDPKTHLKAVSAETGDTYMQAEQLVNDIVRGYRGHAGARGFLGQLTEEIAQLRVAAVSDGCTSAIRHAVMKHGFNEVETFKVILNTIEQQAVKAVSEWLESAGYPTTAILENAIHVKRACKLSVPIFELAGHVTEPFNPSVLRDAEEHVKRTTGIQVMLRNESLAPTQEDFDTLRFTPRILRDAMDAATEVALIVHESVRNTQAGLALFDRETNTWCLREERNLTQILPRLVGDMACHLVKEGSKPTRYLGDVQPRQQMWRMLHTIFPLDDQWIEQSIIMSRFKLAFTNGYWDFELHEFIEGKFPHLRFLVGVRDALAKRNDADVEFARGLVTVGFSKAENADYLLKGLARGLAGDIGAKKAYFIPAPTNTGKSTVTALLTSSLPGCADQFDASNLCNGSRDGGERGRSFAWLAPLLDTRIAISNEIDFSAAGGRPMKINSVTFKRVNSGGEDKMFVRMLYKEQMCTSLQFTMFVLCQDVPEFDNVDDAVVGRTVAIPMDRQAAPEGEDPIDDMHFKRDPEIAAKIRTPAAKNGLRYLLFDMFTRFRAEGHVPPEDVKACTVERTERNTVVDLLSSDYDFWDDETYRHYSKLVNPLADALRDGWSVPVNAIYERLSGARMSQTAIAKELFTLAKVQKHRTKSQRVFVGMRGRAGPGLRN